MVERCRWVTDDPLYRRYHDEEWGVPVRDDQRLFEFLCLEGAQAGLSWLTVLRKRENYRRALRGFDPEHLAALADGDLADLLCDPGLIRNRLKIQSLRTNARAFLRLRSDHGAFSDWLWAWVGGNPVVNHWPRHEDVPARTPLSDELARALKAHGFTFVGSTICYAFLQATGVVMDHTTDCFRHDELARTGTGNP